MTSPTQKILLATVAGEPIYEDDLPVQVLGQLQEARQHEYEVMTQGLAETIRQKLLEAEAKKKGLSAEELLKETVDQKISDPTQGEVEAFYLAQNGSDRRPFEDVKTDFEQALKKSKIQAAREAFLHSLELQNEALILVKRPKVNVSFDPKRFKGSSNSPVTIVEFSDFSCPFCRQAESTLDALFAKYGNRISLAYRDFPLRKTHPQAELAAEASRCALEQGKFWEYHDLLFKSSASQQRDDLVIYSSKLSLDSRRFASCLDSSPHKLQIEQDVTEGTRAGVSATPSFFINGILLKGALSLDSFEEVIDSELALRARPTTDAKN
jgi:protein-disulfide isomerase